MQKKIGYCVNNSYTEDGKPCPKAVTKENQLLLNPFTLRCDTCDENLKIEILEDPDKMKKKFISIGKISGGVLLGALLIFGITKGISLISGKNNKSLPNKTEIVSVIQQGDNKQDSIDHKKDDGIKTKGSTQINHGTGITSHTPGGKVNSVESGKNGLKSLVFPNGDRYEGEIRNGLMQGVGTYYFASRHVISDKDLKHRMADAGDILKGSWNEGSFSTGKLYDHNQRHKETLIIGQ